MKQTDISNQLIENKNFCDKPKGHFGFTLVEILVVVAILGILSAIAIPSYQASALRTGRADGKSALLQEASRQESIFNSTTPPLYQKVDPGVLSTDGKYLVTVDKCAAPGTLSTCYVATATPQGAQVNDECATLTLSNVGEKKSSAGNSRDCWQR